MEAVVGGFDVDVDTDGVDGCVGVLTDWSLGFE